MVVGFFKAILGICRTPPLDAALWTAEGNQVTIRLDKTAALIPVGGAARLEGKGLVSSVLVVHAGGDEYLAFENRCTHGGRKLDPVAGKEELRCCSVNHSQVRLPGEQAERPGRGLLEEVSGGKAG